MAFSSNWQPQTLISIMATALLCLGGGLVAPSSISPGALVGMLPFVAILAMAAIGQHIVIQQRGIDLSAAGIISLSAVIVSALPPLQANGLVTSQYIALALGMGAAAGTINGLFVTGLRVPALITTLGTNALFQGAAVFFSGGHAQQVPLLLNAFAVGRTLGIPNAVVVLAVVVVVLAMILKSTVMGKNFVAVSVSPRAAWALGIRVSMYHVGAFAVAGLLYACAGALLAGYLVTPPVFSGTSYMLATVAAVVVGGNSIAGGNNASIAATVVGAFFLTYLSQLVVSLGYDTSVQFLLQALIVLGSAALPGLVRLVLLTRGRAQ